jgi:hypothetical protein
MKLNYRAFCFSCKQGEQENIPAQWYISGHNGDKPFRGYVCGDHYEMMANDCNITNARWIDIDAITSYHTAYSNFDHMIKAYIGTPYTPTLRPDVEPDLAILKRAFNDRMAELGQPNRA